MSMPQKLEYRLPELAYPYDALDPHIDARTMEIHHLKHHGGYVTKLNAALAGHDDLLALPVTELMRNIERVPAQARQAVINNGGGHANHSLFWRVMSKGGGGEPLGSLAEAIATTFGSFATFKAEFAQAALSRFGSGWAWLGFDLQGQLHVGSTANQDSPLMNGHLPILGLDVWEHAYYLKYQNRRADYIDAWWNVVDWNQVADNFKAGQ